MNPDETNEAAVERADAVCRRHLGTFLGLVAGAVIVLNNPPDMPYWGYFAMDVFTLLGTPGFLLADVGQQVWEFDHPGALEWILIIATNFLVWFGLVRALVISRHRRLYSAVLGSIFICLQVFLWCVF